MVSVEQLSACGSWSLGDGLVVVDLEGADRLDGSQLEAAIVGARACSGVLVGAASQPLSASARRVASVLTTTVATHDVGPVGVMVDDLSAALDQLRDTVAASAVPARMAGQVLRLNEGLADADGVRVESMAYSTLLGGETFRRWRAATPVRDRTPSVDAITAEREGGVLTIRLTRPGRRNALDAHARQELCEALDVAIADPALQVELSGAGPVFCSGGDLDEFGTATDLARAHVLRTEHGPALRMHAVTDRTTVWMHGDCVGAGVELAAFASTVVAAPGTTLRLPEVSMGLIPGAGGTVSVPRRIGRWRAAWLMLTGARLDLDQAVAWGLVDRVG